MKKVKELVFVPVGNAYLTRTINKLSKEQGKPVEVVEQWKKYGTQYFKKKLGIKCDAGILRQAEQLDSESKERRKQQTIKKDKSITNRLEREIQRLFPSIDKQEASAIAAFATMPYSGKVGRTKLSIKDKAELATIAHIRHCHTDYDELLDFEIEQEKARELVRPEIEKVLQEWRKPKSEPQALAS